MTDSITTHKKSAAQKLVEEAESAAQQGDLNAFLSLLRQAVAIEPFHLAANMHLAWYLSQNGVYRESTAALLRLLAVRPYILGIYARLFQNILFLTRKFLHRLSDQSTILKKILQITSAIQERVSFLLLCATERFLHKAPILSSLCTYHRKMKKFAVFNSFEYYKYAELDFAISSGPAKKNAMILDLGSGHSSFVSFLEKQGHFTVSSELEKSALAVQQSFANQWKDCCLSAVCADFRHLPFHESSFDAITLISTIEHVPGDGDIETMQHIRHVLKPGGSLIITVPVEAHASERWTSHTIGHIYSEASDLHNSGGFMRIYDPQTIRERLIEPSGMKIESFKIIGETTPWGWIGLGRNFIDHRGFIHVSPWAGPLCLLFSRELQPAELPAAHWAVGCLHLKKS